MNYRNLAVLIGTLMLVPAAGAVDLMGVYELAQKNDAELRAAEQQLAAAGENPRQARAALLPQVSATFERTLGRSRPEVGGRSLEASDVDQESIGLQLRQSIYDDANYGRLARSRAEYSAAQAEYAEAWLNFLFRVSERYFEVLTALDSQRFARAEETALRRQWEQAEQRFEVGLAAVTDVHEARAAYDGAIARGIQAENQVADAREALREITGTSFEHFARLIDDVPLESPDPDDVDEWVQMAMENNPAVLRQESQVEATSADIRIARAGHLPTLDLTGSYSRSIDNEFVGRDPETQEPLGQTTLQTDGWRVGVTLNVPIFEGFGVSSRRRQAGHAHRAADEVLDQTRRSVLRQTENAYRSVIAGIRQVQALRQAVVSAESALEATNAGFEVGTRTIVDVLQAEQRFFQAERNYSEARHGFILDQLRLMQLVGMLEAERLAEVNQLLD